ncbi:TIGR01457 family HAD-type hydrolase [Jeotgalibacillus proteolyticus]|uniref:TIGR01457 family HAD-type hydrolase n=1 Tax=Jeotgalibacillus proteolyticus TaxID=2082395 RepID=A0A2S5GAM3_9BACL|nr:TIGR01457 family HAD-type hydrolase [Jeotgalibacillus proteolyticus]PPA70087.1 TIGR01457 family HAD-type hydrolase [Jeotgalibacillus proteolyticus]
MKAYKGYLIDLDGTMYRGTERIEEAVLFVKKLHERGIPYLFVTNNSSKTPVQVAEHLTKFDVPVTEEQVFTTSMATAAFISQEKKHASIYVIGGEGIRQALTEEGLELVTDSPDYVVVGLDKEITYEKLALGCLAVRGGARFISTNGDIAIPTERGLLPGNGSLTSVIAVSTQTQPVFIGKPEAIIMEQALKVLGLPKEDVAMIGDNYDTDITAGINVGMDTIIVHTGVTTREILQTMAKQPTYSINSLSEWNVL